MGSRWDEQNGTMNFRQDTHSLVFFLVPAVREESAYHPGGSPSLNAPRVLDHRD